MANYRAEILQLEEILQAGASRVMVDGKSVDFDLGHVRKRLADLRAKDDATIAAGQVRPRASTITMRGF